ncbi:hypothetical protein VE04_09494 [Pseudogymnoascus sp. 24MN13]|nr:hypothetical protein VE04_09494 [Pseudogymnoascus sp. 24MN13]
MHSILLFTTALFATGAISQYSSNRDSCNWREAVPSCYFTNSEEAKTRDLVNGWQLKAWAIEGEHENDCPTLVSPDDCCEEDGARSLLGLKRLWCKDSVEAPKHELFKRCPPDEEDVEKMSKPLWDKFKEICSQGIKPGSAEDVKFLREKVLPYYLNKKWLTKSPPNGWEREWDKIFKKCHKNGSNYCDKAVRQKAGDCVKGMAGSLMLKYGATAMAYCPILDEKLANWDRDDKPQAFKFFTAYCKTKGKSC